MPANFKSTFAFSLCILFCTLLSACSEPQIEQTNQSEPQLSNTTAIPTGEFIKATQVPNTSAERQALINKLSKQSDSHSKRLNLFVRYTELTNSQIKQDVLEQLLSDIDSQLKANSNDHELRALFGSATSLKAIFYLDDVGQTNLLAKKGGRQLDRAVKKAPNHIGVRMYRGITYAEMPAFLGKARFATQDFETIKSAVGNDADKSYISMINYYHGMSLIKDNQKDQGKTLLNQVISTQIAPWATKANELLKEAS